MKRILSSFFDPNESKSTSFNHRKSPFFHEQGFQSTNRGYSELDHWKGAIIPLFSQSIPKVSLSVDQPEISLFKHSLWFQGSEAIR